METRLWTIHHRRAETCIIGEGFSFFALLLPPVWAIWHRAWLVLGAIIVLAVAAGIYNPLAVSPVMYGIGLILGFDGSEIRRLELGLRGWREDGVVEARTSEGAEELWLMGRAA